MIAVLQQLLASVGSFFTSVWDWLTSGLYDLITWATAGFIEWWTLHSLVWSLEAMRFAWDIAREILTDLDLSAQLATAWSALPPDAVGLLSLCRVPEVILMLLNACVTKYVLRFIPGL